MVQKKLKKFINKAYDAELFYYASSLSFNTILSIIPLFLLSFSIFTQLPNFTEYYEKAKNFIISNLLPAHQNAISSYIEQFLSNSVNLGILGLVAIIFTTIMFFDNYSYIVAKLTDTKQNSFWKDFSKYWTLITLAPFGLGFSFYLSAKFEQILNQSEFTSWINLAFILPYLIIWMIFLITYIISINSKLVFKNVLISSFITSLVWNISKYIFIGYTFYNKTYMSLYGSFSVLFFALLWIYISWIIYLYGFKIYIYLDRKEKRIDNIKL